MKFVTLNLNSIRIRKHSIDYIITKENPDIFCFQELKCEENVFPYSFFDNTEYKYFAVVGQKSYNGVAIVSKYPLENIVTDFAGNPVSHEARFVQAEVRCNDKTYTIISLYVVNGADIEDDKFKTKMAFMNALTEHMISISDRPIVIGTDFNICLRTLDACAFDENVPTSVPEREKMQEFLDRSRLYDVYRTFYPNKRQYTWWSYRHNAYVKDTGFRIDYLLSNIPFESVDIDHEFRGLSESSDHTYVVGKIQL